MRLNDKEEIRNFRSDFVTAVAALEEKYEIKIALGNITCSPTEFHTKMTVTTGDEEKANDIARSKFQQLAPMYGFREDDYGIGFQHGRNTMYLVGFNTKARKNPCMLVDDISNPTRHWSAPADLVLHDLGR